MGKTIDSSINFSMDKSCPLSSPVRSMFCNFCFTSPFELWVFDTDRLLRMVFRGCLKIIFINL